MTPPEIDNPALPYSKQQHSVEIDRFQGYIFVYKLNRNQRITSFKRNGRLKTLK